MRAPELNLTIPDAPASGYTVDGTGFDPDSWVWTTIEDTTDGSQPINGPDAFQPQADGTFTRAGDSQLTCGHQFVAMAWVDDEVVALSAPATPACPPADVGTADPDATAAAKAVFATLKAAPAQPDLRLIIGQALRGWDFALPVDQPLRALSAAGLPIPKLIEVDLTDFGVTTTHDAQLFSVLLNHAAQGGLIGLSLHAGNPFTGGDVNDRDGVDLTELAEPGLAASPGATAWRAELDRIAVIMRRLSDAGAVVLFRPLHESNGNWFWWGQRDPADFRAAWRGMFSYVTATIGLHNLLWVYSANRSLGDASSDPTRFFPGIDVVDVVGLDIYDDNLSDAPAGTAGYAAMVGLGKPFAITEYGAANYPTNHDGAKHLPNPKVVRLVKTRYPETVLACCWYSSGGDHWQISDKPNPAALMLDPWAITL